MDAGGLDRIGVGPASDAEPARERHRSRPLLIVALLVAIVFVGGLAWSSSHPSTQRMCTLAGAIDTPEAASPEQAFEAWWAADGPAQVRSWSSSGYVAPDGIQPARDDFTRLDGDTWEWRYLADVSIGIDVGTPFGTKPDGTWAVIGVNQCSYGPVDGRGGA